MNMKLQSWCALHRNGTELGELLCDHSRYATTKKKRKINGLDFEKAKWLLKKKHCQMCVVCSQK